MDNFSMIALAIQWGVIGFFVIIHLLLGFFRGTRKTSYYTVVSLLLTVALLWGLSFISLQGLQGPLLSGINMIPDTMLPANVKSILSSASVLPVLIALLDLVVKLILFFTLYPTLKWLLTFTLFRWIGKAVVPKRKRLGKSKNRYVLQNNVLKKSKHRPRHSVLSRIGGAFIGGFRGFVSGVVLLLPVIVLVGSFYVAAPTAQQTSTNLSGNEEEVTVYSLLNDFSNQGIYKATSAIQVDGKNFSDYMFDFVFSSKVNDEITIKYSEEFKGIANVAYAARDLDLLPLSLESGGSLVTFENYQNISKDDLDQVKVLFDSLGDSRIVKVIIPAAINVGANLALPELLENPYYVEIIEDVAQINFEKEFDTLFEVVSYVLEIDSPSNLMALFNNGADLEALKALLTQENLESLANAINSLTKLEVLTLSTIGLDYALNNYLDDFVTWDLPTNENAKDYYFSRHLERDFFTGPNGIFQQLGNTITEFASQTNEDGELIAATILAQVIENFEDPANYLEEDSVILFSNLVFGLLTNGVVLESIPFGVDYALYELLPEQGIEIEDVADELSEVIGDKELWYSVDENGNETGEFKNLTDVYGQAASIVLGYLHKDKNVIEIAEKLILERTDEIKTIIDLVLGESSAVNEVLRIAAPSLVRSLLEDDVALADIILEVIDNGDDFNYGQELKDVLTIANTLLQATSITEVMDTDFNDIGKLVWLSSTIANNISKEEFESNVVDVLTNLQIVKRSNNKVINYALEQISILDTSLVVMPDEIDLGQDLSRVLSLVYEVSRVVSVELNERNISSTTTGADVLAAAKTVDLANLLTPRLQELLTFDQTDVETSLLFSVLVDQVQQLLANDNYSTFVSFPDALPKHDGTEDVISQAWVDEINTLVSLVFDLGTAFKGDENFTLSVETFETIGANYKDLNIDLITRFRNASKAQDTFKNLGNSYILTDVVVKLANTQVSAIFESMEIDSEFELAPELFTNGKFNANDIPNLIQGLASVVFELNRVYNLETIEDVLQINISSNQLLRAFNQVNRNSLEFLLTNPLLAHTFNDLLEDEGVHNYLIRLANDMANITFADVVLGDFDNGFLKFSNLNLNDLSDLVLSIHALQVDYNLITTNGFSINNVIDYVADLSDAQVANLFGSNLLSFVLTEALSNENVISFASDVTQVYYDFYLDYFTNNVPALAFLSGLEINIEGLISRLSTITTTNHGELRFDHNEFVVLKNLVSDFRDIDIDFTQISINDVDFIKTRLYNVGAYARVSELRILRAYLAEILYEQPGLLDVAKTYIEDLVLQLGYEFEIRDDIVISKEYLDTNNELKANIVEEVLLAAAAQNYDLILGGSYDSKEFIASFLETPFANSSMDRIGYIYNISILDDTLRKATNSGQLDTLIVDIVNGLIDQYASQLNFTPVYLSGDDIELRYTHFNAEAIREIVSVISKMDFDKVTEFTNLNNIGNILRIEESRDLLDEIFEGKLINHVITQVFKQDVAYEIGVELINNRFLAPNGIQNVDADMIRIPEEFLVAKEYSNIVLALYFSDIINNLDFTTELLRGLDTTVNVGNYDPALTRFDFILNANILYGSLNKVITNENFLESVAEFANTQINNFIGVNDLITVNALRVPVAASDENGWLIKDDPKAILRAFNTLNLQSFDELTTLIDRNSTGFIANRNYESFTENLLGSTWLYTIINTAAKSESVREKLASVGSDQLASRLNINHTFDQNDFDITDDNYGIFDQDGNIKRSEIVEFVKAAFVIDLAQLEINGLQTAFSLLELVNQINIDGRSNVLHMLDSNILYAIADKLMNTNANTTYKDLYIKAFNRVIGGIVDVSLDSNTTLFDFDDSVYTPTGLIKKTEISLLSRSFGYVDINKRDLTILHGLINRNIDNFEDKDDFDRMFESKILLSVITNASKDDNLLQAVVDILNSRQSRVELDVDIVTPSSYIYDENGLIKTSEIRNSLKSAELIGVLELEFSHLGIDTITNLVGQNDDGSKDDLDRFFDSISIYTLIAKVMGSDLLGDTLGSIVGDLLNSDITSVDMKPLPSHLGDSGYEDGLIKYSEIRALIEGTKLLGIEGMPSADNVSLGAIMDLIGQNDDGTEDDFDRFLKSNYLVYIMAKLLESNTVKEMLADSANFDKDDFTLEGSDRTDGFLSRSEVRGVFVGLKLLGITDFDNIGFEMGALTSLDDDEQDLILGSTFLYQAIDLSIKGNLDEIPTAALNQDGQNYEGYVAKAEIKKLISALDKLGADDFNAIDPSTLAVVDIKEIVLIDSIIINRLISSELINTLSIPDASYVVGGEVDEFGKKLDIQNVEIINILDTAIDLGIVTVNDLSTIDASTVTTLKLRTMLDKDSPLLDRLMSEQLIAQLESIPQASYKLDSEEDELGNKLDLKRSEIENLIDAIDILGYASVSQLGNLDAGAITTVELNGLYGLDSPLLDRMMSKAMIQSFDDIPSRSYLVGSEEDELGNKLDLERSEIKALIDAIGVLGYTSVSELDTVDASLITTVELNGLYDLDSALLDRMMSKAMIQNVDEVPSRSYLVGSEEDELGNKLDLERSEIKALIDAIGVLGYTSVAGLDSLDASAITTVELNGLYGLNSALLDRMMSTVMIDSFDDIPEESYLVGSEEDELGNKLDLERTEIKALIDAIGVLGYASVSELDNLDGKAITRVKLDGLHNLDSPMLDRVVSTGIIDSGLATVASYVDGSTKDIKRSEVAKLIDDLEVLEINSINNLKDDLDASTLLGLDALESEALFEAQVVNPVDIKGTIIYELANSLLIPAVQNAENNAGVQLIDDIYYVDPISKDMLTRAGVVHVIESL